jgi:ABC-type dipeptide/oligopeptide/nickel transport system permease component
VSGTSLFRFVSYRLAIGLLQLIVVVVTVFVLLRALPANPVYSLLGPGSTHAEYARESALLGLNKPVTTQLWNFVDGVLHGNLGRSWQFGATSIGSQIADALPVSLQLVVLALVLTLLVVIPLGLFSALRPTSRISAAARIYSLAAGSFPDFWLGLMFIFVGWYSLRIFPSPLGLLNSFATPPPTHTHFILIDAVIAGDWGTFGDALGHYALPVLTVAFVLSGPFLKMIRESALATASADFMLYARAVGLPRSAQWRFLLRNSLAPVLTLVGVYFAALLGGSVVIETVFSLPGIGVFSLRSVEALDFPSVESAVLVITGLSLLVYLVMDILHRLVDPRVGLGRQ